MPSILLYSASLSQTGSNPPNATIGPGKADISGSWSRLDTGLYKFTRGSGGYFLPSSGSVYGNLSIQVSTNVTSSFVTFISGSDSSSLYFTTYSSSYTSIPGDNMLPSGSIFQINVNIIY
jgi:hypothetical protein